MLTIYNFSPYIHGANSGISVKALNEVIRMSNHGKRRILSIIQGNLHEARKDLPEGRKLLRLDSEIVAFNSICLNSPTHPSNKLPTAIFFFFQFFSAANSPGSTVIQQAKTTSR
ncbi:hypothetical protein I7I48_07458 [Histoplasma ohiense]|nr:hypothetical protein I7I48_07458 [Histoplasma ohiense (nom. inval.)]